MRISITHLGNSHSDWLRALDFYKGELRILRDRLTEIAGKNTAKEVSAKVEHFQNQLALHNEQVDTLKHDIHHNLERISAEAKTSTAGYIDGVLVVEHDSMSRRFREEEKLIHDLRHEFNEFAIAWM